jgi:hypothetical protein
MRLVQVPLLLEQSLVLLLYLGLVFVRSQLQTFIQDKLKQKVPCPVQVQAQVTERYQESGVLAAKLEKLLFGAAQRQLLPLYGQNELLHGGLRHIAVV